MNELILRIKQALEKINDCDYLIIGAGAGLSTSAGLVYDGKRFFENFDDFHKKYGINDMYTASFYPFETKEELWAQWARHINVNLYKMPSTELYQQLFALIKEKEYFVLTTNVESQFEKSGFPKDKIFEVQGNYAYLQCAKRCHDKLYENKKIISKMIFNTNDCKIPSSLIPKCNVCGGDMDINLRHNDMFVEDEKWFKAKKRYTDFLQKSNGKSIVFLELGVGFNTPGIIRYPFEKLTYQNPNATLIRFNKDYPSGTNENVTKTISFDEDIASVVCELLSGRNKDGNANNTMYA